MNKEDTVVITTTVDDIQALIAAHRGGNKDIIDNFFYELREMFGSDGVHLPMTFNVRCEGAELDITIDDEDCT